MLACLSKIHVVAGGHASYPGSATSQVIEWWKTAPLLMASTFKQEPPPIHKRSLVAVRAMTQQIVRNHVISSSFRGWRNWAGKPSVRHCPAHDCAKLLFELQQIGPTSTYHSKRQVRGRFPGGCVEDEEDVRLQFRMDDLTP